MFSSLKEKAAVAAANVSRLSHDAYEACPSPEELKQQASNTYATAKEQAANTYTAVKGKVSRACIDAGLIEDLERVKSQYNPSSESLVQTAASRSLPQAMVCVKCQQVGTGIACTVPGGAHQYAAPASAEGRTDVKRHVVNLDAPPAERWLHILPEYLEGVDIAFEGIFEKFDGIKGSRTILTTAFSGFNKLGSTEYSHELQGIATALGRPVGELAMLQICYEAMAGCTSIVTEVDAGLVGGEAGVKVPYHIRNLDWPAANLDKISMQALFVRDGQVVYEGSTFAGYCGILTGLRPGSFSVSINARTSPETNSHGAWNNIMNLTHGLFGGKWPIAFLVRQVLEQQTTYNDALEAFRSTPLMAATYVIVAGVLPGEGCVITRTRRPEIELPEWHMSESGPVVQCNMDFFRDDPGWIRNDLNSISGGPQQNETHFQRSINFLERHSGIDLDRDGDIGEVGSPHQTPAEDIGFVRGVANVEVDYDFQDNTKKLRRTATGTETKVNMPRHSHERRKVVRHAIDTAGAGESPDALWGVLSNFPLHCVHHKSTVYTAAMCAATGLHQTRTELTQQQMQKAFMQWHAVFDQVCVHPDDPDNCSSARWHTKMLACHYRCCYQFVCPEQFAQVCPWISHKCWDYDGCPCPIHEENDGRCPMLHAAQLQTPHFEAHIATRNAFWSSSLRFQDGLQDACIEAEQLREKGYPQEASKLDAKTAQELSDVVLRWTCALQDATSAAGQLREDGYPQEADKKDAEKEKMMVDLWHLGASPLAAPAWRLTPQTQTWQRDVIVAIRMTMTATERSR